MNKDDLPLILTSKDIQVILRCGREKLYEYARRPDFPRLPGHRRIRVLRDDFFAWLNRLSTCHDDSEFLGSDK